VLVLVHVPGEEASLYGRRSKLMMFVIQRKSSEKKPTIVDDNDNEDGDDDGDYSLQGMVHPALDWVSTRATLIQLLHSHLDPGGIGDEQRFARTEMDTDTDT
jgi:hypothetical protein